jgi:hypothetical protein
MGIKLELKKERLLKGENNRKESMPSTNYHNFKPGPECSLPDIDNSLSSVFE